MKKFLMPLFLFSTMAAAQNLTQYVDPTIGSGGHGHVFVGANVPFGFVELGPTSIPQQWDWCSGYHVSDSTAIGFSHTHLSGTGIGDLFDVTMMPVVGRPAYARGEEIDPKSGLWSYIERSTQVVRPGYYKGKLLRYGITAELTATQRVGMHRYTFPQSTDAAIVIDLMNGGCWDKATEVHMEQDEGGISGYRYSTGWAKNQKIFFHVKFNKRIDGVETTADGHYARINFQTGDGEKVLAKVSLSPTSVAGAKANMAAELPGWDFDATAKAADKAWNDELSRVVITTDDAQQRRIFYTAMYHEMFAPNVFCDVNGDYRGSDDMVRQNTDEGEAFVNYTTYSLWDTYRAQHPLMTLIHSDRMPDFINTMLHIYKEQGKLPVWHLMANETDCMVGNPGVAVVGDAVMKDIEGLDQQLAFEAMKTSAMLDERGLKEYRERGYIAVEDGNENVSRTLEYALADWAVAQAAKKLGKTDDYNYFLKRSKSYTNVFDKKKKFMRGRHADGTFRTTFDPFVSSHEQDDFTEGNAWQYTWLVPHDIDGLVRLFGNKKALISKLDSLFVVTGDLGKNASPDISGLIGQYAHGNEPSHHIVYFYTMLGEPWKTADLVRQINTTLYHDQPDGLSGNEDVGQMSAWYILSSLGFYQVEPAGGRYVLGSPLFNRADLRVKGGTFSIIAKDNSPENRYIQSVKLNGKILKKYWVDYADIARGGTLEIQMGKEKKKWY